MGPIDLIGPNDLVGSIDLIGPNYLVGPIDLIGPNDLVGPIDLIGPNAIVGPIDLIGPNDLVDPIGSYWSERRDGLLVVARRSCVQTVCCAYNASDNAKCVLFCDDLEF